MNVTFYRFPRLSMLRNWFDSSPPDFRFAVKAPRAITHFKQFHNCQEMLSSFYATIAEGLEEKLGPVLFQLPPRFTYTDDKLERILKNLDPAFLNVVEFRHPSWWQPAVWDRLAQHRISFCGMSHPELPQQLVINCPLVYYRFHGVPDLYRTLYPDEVLKQFITEVAGEPAVKETWIYFNNDMEAHAPKNAAALQSFAG